MAWSADLALGARSEEATSRIKSAPPARCLVPADSGGDWGWAMSARAGGESVGKNLQPPARPEYPWARTAGASRLGLLLGLTSPASELSSRGRIMRPKLRPAVIVLVAVALVAAIPSVALGAKPSASISLTNPSGCDLSATFTWSGLTTSTGGNWFVQQKNPLAIVAGPVSLPATSSGMSTLTVTNGTPGQMYGAFASLVVTKKNQAKLFPGGELGTTLVLPLTC
jgi:hypothetical protein